MRTCSETNMQFPWPIVKPHSRRQSSAAAPTGMRHGEISSLASHQCAAAQPAACLGIELGGPSQSDKIKGSTARRISDCFCSKGRERVGERAQRKNHLKTGKDTNRESRIHTRCHTEVQEAYTPTDRHTCRTGRRAGGRAHGRMHLKTDKNTDEVTHTDCHADIQREPDSHTRLCSSGGRDAGRVGERLHRKNYSKAGNDAYGESHADGHTAVQTEADTATTSQTDTSRQHRHLAPGYCFSCSSADAHLEATLD